MDSEHVGAEFLVLVHLPPGYRDTSSLYPVLYQLDGSQQSRFVAETLENQSRAVVVVGIAYPSRNERVRDYSPSVVADYPGTTGGSSAFIEFLRDELVPRIERDYRVSSDRAVMGHSLGGLATTTILVTDPDDTPVFSRVASISPSYWWGDGQIFGVEEERAAEGRPLDVRYFVAVGELEPIDIVSTTDLFVERLEGRGYGGLELRHVMIGGARHNETWMQGYPVALEWLYGP